MCWGDELQRQQQKLAKAKVSPLDFSETMKNLREEAKQKDISINTLLNQIIKEYLNWHSNAAKAGFIAVRRLLQT